MSEQEQNYKRVGRALAGAQCPSPLSPLAETGGEVHRQGHVIASIDRLEHEVVRLSDLRDDILRRLDTVMSPPEPCGVEKDDRNGSGVPLCLRIDALTDRIVANSDALKDILDRLEV